MTTHFAVNDVCCVALELSKSTWVCAFAPPESGRASVHKMRAGDVGRLLSILETGRARAMRDVSRSLEIVLCYEVGYDGFWLARLLMARGIRTVVFDPASFLKPRRGRLAKTGIWLSSKRINKRLQGCLDTMMTGDGRRLPPFLRHDIERMIRHYEFICGQLAEVEADRKLALTDETSSFPHRDKVRRLVTLGSVGETTATVLVAEVFHRTFETRRHLASFIGLAPSPYASGDVSRDRGINKAGTKLARQTLVELAWFWLRYQPNSKLALWRHGRFGGMGMRGRKVGIVALARKLAIALWRFLEQGVVPEGATLKV
jgi:transposase